MSSTHQEPICLYCFLQPCINMALIYGIEPYISCNHNNRKPPVLMYKVLKNIYFGFIEFVFWGNAFIALWQLIPALNVHAPCIQIYKIFKSGVTIMKMAYFFLSVSCASAFTFIKNKKISLKIDLRSTDYCRQQKAKNININVGVLSLRNSFIINSFLIWIQILAIGFILPYVQKNQKFQGEALFCTVQYGMWLNFLIGGICNILLLLFMFLWVAQKEFQEVLNELKIIRSDDANLQFKLEKFMMHHEELWKWVSQISNKYSYLFIAIYFDITSATSLCYYMYLFIETENVIRYFILGLLVLQTFICIIYGFVLSSLAFNMTNSFQEIRRYEECCLHLEQKLKILDFMKRFGKVPLGLSMGGLFNLNKRFPIKMASTLYSVFSGLLKLRNVSHQKINCGEISTINNTDF